MDTDYRMGYPPALDEAFMVDYEQREYGWVTSDWVEGYPLGTPRRVLEELRQEEHAERQATLEYYAQRKRRVVLDKAMASDFPALREAVGNWGKVDVVDPHGMVALWQEENRRNQQAVNEGRVCLNVARVCLNAMLVDVEKPIPF